MRSQVRNLIAWLMGFDHEGKESGRVGMSPGSRVSRQGWGGDWGFDGREDGEGGGGVVSSVGRREEGRGGWGGVDKRMGRPLGLGDECNRRAG